MPLVIIIEPHTLLRLGILQILANIAPSLQLEGTDYSGLSQQGPPVNRNVDLVVLSIPAYDKMHDMIHAAQRAYAPK